MDLEVLAEQVLLSNLIQANPAIQKAFKKVSSISELDLKSLEAKAHEKFESIKKAADELLKKDGDNGPVKIYMDGCFDLIHAGHYNAIR
jgi:bifunctional ADP-heptose synthase (sugar kinase/adenylyltransferase)